MYKLVLLFALVATALAGSGQQMGGKFRRGYKSTDICSAYPDEDLCQSAMDRCTVGMKRSFHRSMKDKSFKDEKKQNFKDCVQQVGLDKQFTTFEDTMNNKKDAMNQMQMNQDQSGGVGVQRPLRFNIKDQQGSAAITQDYGTGMMSDDDDDQYDDSDNDEFDFNQLSGRNHHNEGDDDESNEDDGHQGQGHGRHHGHGKCDSKAKKFLDTLADGLAKDLRCCMLTKAGKMVGGSINIEVFKTKLTEKIRVDPTVLESFKQGFDTCQKPTDCDLMDFKECALKSCIDKVLQEAAKTKLQ